MDKKPSIATPPGILIRSLKSGDRIQIAFSWNGQQCRELIPPCAINKSSIAYAANLRNEIRRKIADGSFEYAEYFPESPKAQKSNIASTKMDDLLDIQLARYKKQMDNGKLSPSTYKGYFKSLTGERCSTGTARMLRK